MRVASSRTRAGGGTVAFFAAKLRTVVLAAATLSAPGTWSGATDEGMA